MSIPNTLGANVMCPSLSCGIAAAYGGPVNCSGERPKADGALSSGAVFKTLDDDSASSANEPAHSRPPTDKDDSSVLKTGCHPRAERSADPRIQRLDPQ